MEKSVNEVMDTLEMEELKKRIQELEDELKESKDDSDKWFMRNIQLERKYNDLKKAFINFVEDLEA